MHTSQASYPHKIEKDMKFRDFQEKSQCIIKFDNSLVLSWELYHNDSNYMSIILAFSG